VQLAQKVGEASLIQVVFCFVPHRRCRGMHASGQPQLDACLVGFLLAC
jgi:hypothetical protein